VAPVSSSARKVAAALLAAAAIACVFAFFGSPRGGRGPRPDVVLVVWDTCRGDRVSVNGYAHPTTPRLGELAARGTTFRRCFTPATWTPPAHASLFTGLLPRDHGVHEGVGGERVAQGIPVLAETLRDAGYETYSVTANGMLAFSGLGEGFERVDQVLRSEDTGGTGQDAVAAVRAWRDRRRKAGEKRPYFLFVNLMECHQPYVFDAACVAAARGDAAVNGARRAAAAIDIRRTKAHLFEGDLVGEAEIRDLDAAYDGSVRLDDRWTGEILDLLREDGSLDGAFVAVCGDHGENLGEHGELGHVMSVYEPTLRVPLVVRWPGRLEGGRTEDAEVRLQDLYPTILQAARVPVPKPCGKDAVSLAESPLRPRVLVSEHGPTVHALPGIRQALPNAPASLYERFECVWRTVREPASAPGARKYLQVIRPADAGPPRVLREELYDLAADPGETRNLLAPGAPPAERATADRLRDLLDGGR
jgi:arylsulfatase A-like enzyme